MGKDNVLSVRVMRKFMSMGSLSEQSHCCFRSLHSSRVLQSDWSKVNGAFIYAFTYASSLFNYLI